MIAGDTTLGATSIAVHADTGYLMPFTMPTDGTVTEVVVAMDGLGSAHGDQVVTGVLYDAASGALLASAPEVSVLQGTALTWVSFGLDPMALAASKTYYAGILAGTVDQSATISASAATATGKTFSSAYSGGPPSSLPSLTAAADFTIWVAYSLPFTVPDNVTDDWVATLAFPVAQQVLSATGVLFGSGRDASVGWHGTLTDPSLGAFCIVNSDGPLSDLVGERLKVTCNERSVFVYCHTDGDVLEDLSLTRRAFMALDFLAVTELDATVEIVAAST